MKPSPMSDDDVQNVVAAAITDAVSFIESDIAPERIKAQKYYDGRVDVPHEEGRSRVVATKARDVVRAVKPSLMRVFLQSDKPVEFVPRGPEDVAGAEQATAYVNWKFNECNGYRLLSSVTHDALVKKTGIAKVFWEEKEEVTTEEYSNLTDDQLAFLLQDDAVSVAEHSARTEDIDGFPVTFHDLVIEVTKPAGDIRLEAIPPEEFFVDEAARCIEDAYICGHASEKRVSDLVEMGIDFEEAAGLDTESQDEEDFERRRTTRDSDTTDASMKKVLVAEAYIRMDVEGTGKARLYKVLCGGTKYKVLRRELVDEAPFAIFEVEPEPHAFFGKSLVDLVIEDQNAATVMLRGLLDNIVATNIPRTLVNPDLVNVDDVLNNEIGGVIRTRDMSAVQELAIPFNAGATLPALDYFDSLIEQKTGVTRASMGLAPDALQSTTAAAVNATVQGAAGQSEIIARNLAEGGMKRLFRLMMKLTIRHVSAETHMRLSGQFIPVDPRAWNASMDVTANVGLGTGRHEERAMVLREIMADQTAMWQAYGPGNGLVTLTNIRNVRADILRHSGIPNADRYYQQMSPEIEAQMQAQAQAAQGEVQPDPNMLIAQAELMKAQARMKEAENDTAVTIESKIIDDDLARDRMAQDAFFKAAEMEAKYRVRPDMTQLAQVQAMPR